MASWIANVPVAAASAPANLCIVLTPRFAARAGGPYTLVESFGQLGGSRDERKNSNEIPIGTLPFKRGEEIRIYLSEYKGVVRMHLRVWYEDDKGEYKPSKQGFTVKLDQIEPLAELIARAMKIVTERRLLPADANRSSAN